MGKDWASSKLIGLYPCLKRLGICLAGLHCLMSKPVSSNNIKVSVLIPQSPSCPNHTIQLPLIFLPKTSNPSFAETCDLHLHHFKKCVQNVSSHMPVGPQKNISSTTLTRQNPTHLLKTTWPKGPSKWKQPANKEVSDNWWLRLTAEDWMSANSTTLFPGQYSCASA